MIYTIFNEKLSASIDSHGAQLRSLRSADGTEYLWQGDELHWADSSPVLFPYIARLYEKSYCYQGQRYSMDIHGFACRCEFDAEDIAADSISFVLHESDDTLAQYPFRFSLRIRYSLEGSSLRVGYTVSNNDSRLMPFAIGGHPGFNVPMGERADFDRHYLAFDEACEPVRIGFTDELFLSGEDNPYPLVDGRIIPLVHSLFDEDAIILKNTAKALTLGCKDSERSVHISFPDFNYFGIWHAPKSQAPYVCLEPWSSLPSRQGVVEELCEKDDMIMLQAGEVYDSHWLVTIT